MSFSMPSQPAAPIAPAAPAPAPMFGQPSSPQGSKPQAKASQPTFLGAQLGAQPAQQGQKTLLGT